MYSGSPKAPGSLVRSSTQMTRALAGTVGMHRLIAAVDSRGGRVCIHGWKTVLPLTAVGKVFKPALRLRAIELRLTDLALELAPGRAVQVSAVEEGGRQRAEVRFAGAEDPALAERLQGALAAIAVPTAVRFGG